MIAKGQVNVINIVPPGRSAESRHSIFLNLKTSPDRELDYELLEKVYQLLLARAMELKDTLPDEYITTLCVGNDASELANTKFSLKKRASLITIVYSE